MKKRIRKAIGNLEIIEVIAEELIEDLEYSGKSLQFWKGDTEKRKKFLLCKLSEIREEAARLEENIKKL